MVILIQTKGRTKIYGLINGKIYGTPPKRRARYAYQQAVKAVAYLDVIAFDNQAVNTLLSLHEGDAVSMAGTVTVSAYTDKHGDPRPSVDITAQQILTAYHIRHKRQQVQNNEGDQNGN